MRRSFWRASAALGVLFCVWWGSGLAQAQTGVSGDRVSLPEGAGSLEGVGENVNIDPNMGLMNYSLPIELPTGFPDMTPMVSLTYSSGNPNSVVGVGWHMPMGSIERMTHKGLPEYEVGDRFAANGSLELVHIPQSDPPTYRARFEGGFVRYTWLERGEGQGGYWRAEWPDGRISYYGADSQGVTAADSRIEGFGGTFHYGLVETVDVWGHRIRYRYRRAGDVPVLRAIEWVFDEDNQPRFEARFAYESRSDAIIDAAPGLEIELDERLVGVEVLSSGIPLQSYALTYEDEETSGGVSRLRRFERFGQNGQRYPAVLDFEYSRALGGVCEGDDCNDPYLVQMGNLGVNLRAGTATLIDINGDALPDVVNTGTDEVNHRFFINTFDGPDQQSFQGPIVSALGTSSGHNLRAGTVQVLDVDGDGFTDMLNTRTGRVLRNGGSGDWIEEELLFEDSGDLPDLAAEIDDDLDPGDGDLLAVRFIDYDNDKRIDVIKSVGAGINNETTIFRNLGEAGFALDPEVENIGQGFDSGTLDLADMNGDGLLDPVRLGIGSLTYQLNLGHGRWAAPAIINDLPFEEDDRPFVEIEDLNNDGLADLVVVRPGEISYALGQSGESFAPEVTLNSFTLGVELPVRDAETTVLYADMNGSGSTDIVWIDLNGNTAYLELFPIQSNLISKITNGLGMVQEIEYGTSVEQRVLSAQRGQPWTTPLPHPMTVVTRLDVYDTLNDLHEVTELSYYNGFYDGDEKSFRGFERVESATPGDESMEDGLTRVVYNLGDDDPHHAGLMLSQEVFSAERLLSSTIFEYEDCPVAQIPPDLQPPVRYVCQSAVEQTVREGADAAEQAVSRQEFSHDGYGNVSRVAQLGVISIGDGQGCEPCQRDPEVFGSPCGQTCVGDELYTETQYLEPENNLEGRWIVNRMHSLRMFGRPGSPVVHEKEVYYDGEPFVGLELGQATLGVPIRTRVRVDGDRWADELRQRVNADGRVEEVLLADGDLEVDDDRRYVQQWDDLGFLPRHFEYLMKTPEGEPYRLRQRVRFDPAWNRPTEISHWFAVQDGQPVAQINAESIIYDAFGRVAQRFFPTDSIDQPSERLTYELGDPISRITIEQRSERNGDFDLKIVRCFDGFGRQFQERRQVGPQTWLVGGFTRYNTRGQAFRVYSRYESDSEACDTEPPAGVSYQEVFVDTLRRPLRSVHVTDDVQRVRRYQYGPLFTLEYDAEDSDPDSPFFDTPTRHDHDGLGRRTATHRLLSPVESQSFVFAYDELNRFAGTTDPDGNTVRHTHNLAGHLVRVEDPDRGTTVYENDDQGRPTSRTDARGMVYRYEYDGYGRRTAVWDEAMPEMSRINYRYDIPRDCPQEQCTHTGEQLVEINFEADGQPAAYWYGYTPGRERSFGARTLGGARFDFGWSYDNIGNLTQMTFPGGRTLDFEHDTAMRLQGISGVLEGVGYDTATRPEAFVFSNGVTETFAYNAEERINNIDVIAPNNQRLVSRQMTFDGVGNLTELQDNAVNAQRPSANTQYTFDALYRMTQAHLDQGRDGFDELLLYRYDLIDNLTSKTSSQGEASPAHVGELSYGGAGAGPHAVTRAGGLDMSYDQAGNMTRKGQLSIQWDCFGRVGGVELGQQLTQYAYGPGNRRVLTRHGDHTTWSISDQFEVRNGVAVIQVDVGERRLAEIEFMGLAPMVMSDLNEDEQIDAADAWMSQATDAGVIEEDPQARRDTPGALLEAAVARLLVGEGQTTFFHADHQSNVMATTDQDGQLLEQRTYYPYGLERQNQQARSAGFNGQVQVDGAALVAFDARHFDPQLGRWLSPDPLYDRQGSAHMSYPAEVTSAYAGMINNPASFRDGDGQSVVATFAVLGMEMAINSWSFAAAGFGAGVGAAQSMRDNEVENQAFLGESLTGTQTALAAVGGAIIGGVFGFASGGLSGVVAAGVMAITEPLASRFVNPGSRFSVQTRVTARRVFSAVLSFGIGTAVAVGLTAATGGAFPVAAVALGGVALGVKLIAYGIAHHDGFSRLKRWASGAGAAPSTTSQRRGSMSLSRQASLSDSMRAFAGSGDSAANLADLSRNLSESQRRRRSSSRGNATGRAARRASRSSTP